MFKKAISFMLVFCMFAAFIPAASATPDSQPVKSVEEILNEYHAKSFEAQASKDSPAAANSRSSTGNAPTLEQETVDQLNAAGYEAYNVTSANYNSLQAQLKTDFSDIGLSPNGSYIIVISGEDESNANSRAGGNFDQIIWGDGGGNDQESSFTHTYNGKTYSMRYVTVTAADNDEYGMTSNFINLRQRCGLGNLLSDLNIPITILSSIGVLSNLGTIYSLITATTSLEPSTRTKSLEFKASSNWTVKYIQVYNSDENVWQFRASTEYVTMHYTYFYEHYVSTSNQYESKTISGYYPNMISEHYEHKDYMKDTAAWVHEEDSIWSDEVSFIEYEFNGRTVITHSRGLWESYF